MHDHLPKIHEFKKVDSVLDVGRRLYAESALGEWESIIAQQQTNGRGQMRRDWASPPGNLYACWRLPMAWPFSTNAAPIIIAFFCSQGLSRCGFNIQIKWPNDLVLKTDMGYAKCGGILLEERDGFLAAGIGVNISESPPKISLRPDASLPAAALSVLNGALPTPSGLWKMIVRTGLSIYKDPEFLKCWLAWANENFIWLGSPVRVVDGDSIAEGIFEGITINGTPILRAGDGIVEITGGEMRLVSPKS